MERSTRGLSDRSAHVLGLIAEGRSYDQILQRHPELTYLDIFAAAQEALDLLRDAAAEVENVDRATEQTDDGDLLPPTAPAASAELGKRPSFVERARATHGRAFTRWTGDEDARLEQLFREGAAPVEIAGELDRHEGAIWRRLVKLGLVEETEQPTPRAGRGQPRSGPGQPSAEQPASRTGRDRRRSRSRQPATESLQARIELAGKEGRPEPEPSSPIVPGWEAFRDRLNDERDGT